MEISSRLYRGMDTLANLLRLKKDETVQEAVPAQAEEAMEDEVTEPEDEWDDDEDE